VSTFYDKTYGGQAVVQPWDNLTLTFNAIYGTYLPPLSRRTGEVIGLYQMDERWSFAFDYAFGQDDSPVPAGVEPAWSSFVVYARWQMAKDWAAALRGEDFVDHDGAQMGYAADFREGTLTFTHPLSPQLLVRLEGRYDWAVNPRAGYAPVAAFNGSPDQLTFTLGAVFGF
jgi:hypothetical protein